MAFPPLYRLSVNLTAEVGCVTVLGMDILIYFLTVVPIGSAFLAVMWRRDAKMVPTGENFMPTLDEMKDFI